MEIKNELVPRDRRKSLLLVAGGKQAAKVYLLEDKALRLAGNLRLPNPQREYSDKESNARRSGPSYRGSSSDYEPKKQYAIRSFLEQVRERMKEIGEKEKPETIYLFAPRYRLEEIKGAIGNELTSRLKGQFEGNYLDDHPFSLLQKIKDQESLLGETSPQSEKAAKLIGRQEP